MVGRRGLACLLVVLGAAGADAASPLFSLSGGTRCTVERAGAGGDVPAGRHAVTCTATDGTRVRLVLTRKGRIACPRRQRSCQTGNTAQVLTLGRGTACLLLPDSAVRAAYRIRRRHGLVCAEPRGRLLRALMAPGGQVDCEDSVDLDANGQPLPGGPACAPATDPSGTVPTPVNLTGRWQVEAYPYTCQLTAEQNGDELSLDITCPGVIGLQAEGVVTFADHRLTSTGTVSGFPCGAPATLDAVVSPDGNHAQGTVGCGGIQLAFTSDRRLDDTPTP